MKIKMLVLACCFLGSMATTRAQVGAVKVSVPFEFNFAKQNLPAGEYLIWSVRDQLYLRIAGGRTVGMVQSDRTLRDGGKTGKVVFNCYEKRCFLSQLWTPDPDRSRQISRSKPELELAKREDAQQFALLGQPSN